MTVTFFVWYLLFSLWFFFGFYFFRWKNWVGSVFDIEGSLIYTKTIRRNLKIKISYIQSFKDSISFLFRFFSLCRFFLVIILMDLFTTGFLLGYDIRQYFFNVVNNLVLRYFYFYLSLCVLVITGLIILIANLKFFFFFIRKNQSSLVFYGEAGIELLLSFLCWLNLRVTENTTSFSEDGGVRCFECLFITSFV